ASSRCERPFAVRCATTWSAMRAKNQPSPSTRASRARAFSPRREIGRGPGSAIAGVFDGERDDPGLHAGPGALVADRPEVLDQDLVVARVDRVVDPERVEPLLGFLGVRAVAVGHGSGGAR